MSSPLLTLSVCVCVCICILCCATWKSFLWKHFSCFHCGMVAALKLTAPPRQFLKSEGTCTAFDQGDVFLCGFYHAAQGKKWIFISPKRTRCSAHHPESKEKVELESGWGVEASYLGSGTDLLLLSSSTFSLRWLQTWFFLLSGVGKRVACLW